MHCSNKVTTSSGTFTAYNDKMSRCEAKKFCQNKGHILAPITNQEDKDAVIKMLYPGCPQHRGPMYHYHIGLDVSYCGKSQDRVFTNGVKYNDKIHGRFYTDTSSPDDKCPMAYLVSRVKSVVIGVEPYCNPQKIKVLCLDQSTASPLVQDNTDFSVPLISTNVFVGVGGLFVVVGCLVFAKMYSYIRYLENKLTNRIQDNTGYKQ